MAFPLVLRSTLEATKVRLEAEAKIARSDADRAQDQLRETRQLLDESQIARTAAENLVQEMAQTLLELASSKPEKDQSQAEEDQPAPNLNTSPRSRIQMARDMAIAHRKQHPRSGPISESKKQE